MGQSVKTIQQKKLSMEHVSTNERFLDAKNLSKCVTVVDILLFSHLVKKGGGRAPSTTSAESKRSILNK